MRWLKEGGRNLAIESTVHIVVIIHPGLLSIIIKRKSRYDFSGYYTAAAAIPGAILVGENLRIVKFY